jgi:hypothetical protein
MLMDALLMIRIAIYYLHAVPSGETQGVNSSTCIEAFDAPYGGEG